MVAGGAAVYAAALPVADAQILTEVHLSPEGDTFYPDWDRSRVGRDAALARTRPRVGVVGAADRR